MGLFEDFDKVSYQQWMDKIIIDLKGKDFKDTLVWNSNEGIDVQPFYNSSSKIKTTTPFKKNNNWIIRETVFIDTIENANKKALLALKGGANAIYFVGEINSQKEMNLLLKDIQTEIIELHFYNSTPKQTLTFSNLTQGSVCSASFENNLPLNINELAELTTTTPSHIKTITINSNLDNSLTKELAHSLSKGVEYLNLLTDKGIDAQQISAKMQFTFGISTNYFFEIAKFRAARILWNTILNQYGVNDEMTIHAETTIQQSSNEDKNYEILRNTTKAMSAIIGGCDSLTVLPHDNEKLDFSNRIARNIQHILKEEAFFDKVTNPADGSYYIEELTHQIAQKAWILFQEIEKNGGFRVIDKKIMNA